MNSRIICKHKTFRKSCPTCTKEPEKLVNVFSTGSQYIDWSSKNCEGCVKSTESAKKCDIEAAFAFACFDEGKVPESIAVASGLKSDKAYCWKCPERSTEKPPPVKRGPRKDPNQMSLLGDI